MEKNLTWLPDYPRRSPVVKDQELSDFLLLFDSLDQGDPFSLVFEELSGGWVPDVLRAVGAVTEDEFDRETLDGRFIDYLFPNVRVAHCDGCQRAFFDSHKQDWSLGGECRECFAEFAAKD